MLGLQLFKPPDSKPQRYDAVLSKVLLEKDKKIPAVSWQSFQQAQHIKIRWMAN
mgnify:FL=1